MKNLINDNSAVAYLLLVGLGLTLIVTGITYSFVSDFIDFVLSAINNYSGTPLANQMPASATEGGNFLIAIFKMCLVPILFIIMYWIFTMSMKPVKPF